MDVRLYKIVTTSRLCESPLSYRARGNRPYADEIVGVWLDAGRHDGFACSLDGKTLEEVTNKSWDQWIVSHRL